MASFWKKLLGTAHSAVAAAPPAPTDDSGSGPDVDGVPSEPRRRSCDGAPAEARPRGGHVSFSESELVDSGVARTLSQDLRSLMDDTIDPLPPSSVLSEDVLLSKIQDIQLELAELRRMKEALLSSNSADTSAGLAGSFPHTNSLLVASFRLPVALSTGTNGRVKISVTSGGILAAFKSVKTTMKVWWMGLPVGEYPEDEREDTLKKLTEDYCYIAVSAGEDYLDIHTQFCNSVLWPLYHYLPLSLDADRDIFHPQMFEAYERVNEDFANTLLKHYREGDVFWIHDFQLMLVPQKLRAKRPNAKIGFFLHTPFPSAEIYRILPTRREMLEGILGADLVGFHTYDYARHFLSACTRVLCLETRPNGVEYKGVFVRVGVFPIGIDASSFVKALRSPAVIQRREELQEQLAGKKVIIGVDRVDYIKGIPHKLLGLEHFLSSNPEWVGRVLLIQIGVPSTSGRKDYHIFRSVIHEMVGRINGEFATLEDMPIHYLEQNISYEDLVSLYSIADVALITSLRDGMNLISYEYLMCQQENRGVLVVSEFTGAAQSLPGALVCNPWNIEGISDCILKALTMPESERRLNYKKIHEHITRHTSTAWGQNFVSDLIHIAEERLKAIEKMTLLDIDALSTKFRNCKRRLILLDYDGTLIKKRSLPQLAKPSPRLMKSISLLLQDPGNIIFVLTERDTSSAVQWIGSLDVGLAAEHGYRLLWPSSHEDLRAHGMWVTIGPTTVAQVQDILPRVVSVLETYEDLTPGSFVIVKESSATWYFRDADPEFASSQAQEVQHVLEDLLDNSAMEVTMGQKVLYVQPRGVNKGETVRHILETLSERKETPDMVLSFGDDRTDEDMFYGAEAHAAEGTEVITCTVGRKNSHARFFVEDVDDVIFALEALCR